MPTLPKTAQTGPFLSQHPVVEAVLDAYCPALGADFTAYRHHVYRVLNLCQVLARSWEQDQEKFALAAMFHDLGLWVAGNWDYLGPSQDLARRYLVAQGCAAWVPEVEAMIHFHHKRGTYRGPYPVTVEALRRADLVDLTGGWVRYGLPVTFHAELRRAFPYAGFHRALLRWFGRHVRRQPWRPLPMLTR